jgi:pimeloyl-ACP methyl ester carboxylesterase
MFLPPARALVPILAAVLLGAARTGEPRAPMGGQTPAGPAATLSAPSIATAAPAQPPETREGEAIFNIFFRGTAIGFERVQVTATPEGWIIGSTGRVAAPLDLIIQRFEVRYDRTWKPLELVIDATRRNEPLALRTSFSGETATTRIDRPGLATDQVTAKVASDAVVVPPNYVAAYEALGVRLASLAPGGELRLFVPPQGEVAVRLRSASLEQIQIPGRLVRARRYRITFLYPANPMDAEVWTDEQHRLLRVSLPAAELDAAREEIVTVAARRRAVTNPGDRDVRIAANGFTLAATITPPAQAAELPPGTKVRWPAVILVPGALAQDRDETSFGIPIYGQLAGHLAARGFLVVRYDKRGLGQSGGRADSATLEDYAEDVRAVVAFLERRDEVDRTRIVVFGHGEGGLVALAAAARDDRIDGLVLASTPATSGAEFVLEQQQELLARSTLSDLDKAARVELQKKLNAAVLGTGSWDGLPEALRRQADTPWFRSLLAFDPAAVLSRVRQPLLVIHGELDRQVAPHHADRLVALANARRNPPVTELRRLPRLNHLLVEADTGEVDEYQQLVDRQVSPEIALLIDAWVKKVLTHGRRG